MPNTARARIFRSTNITTNVNALATTFGTTANSATSAQYATGGTVTWRRWVPGSATSDALTPPAAPPPDVFPAAAKGWRDDAAQHATFLVRYAAGTWTVRVRLTKTGQAVVADMTVRVMVIVYRMNSAGTFQQEIGRVQIADTTLSTTTLTLSGSFTTAAVTDFAAGDRLHTECYITPIVAGTPAAPAAAVNVNFIVDETSANSGASFTAQPTYLLFAETTGSATGLGTASGVFGATGAMTGTATGLGTASGLTSAVANTTGTAAGLSSVAGVLAGIGGMTGTATGLGDATGVLGATGGMTGTSTGLGTASGVLSATSGTTGTATGLGTASGLTSSVAGSVGSASGSSIASGLASIVLSTTGTAGFGDVPLNNPTKAIAATVRDSSGNPVAGATVKLFRQSDDVLIATTTSAVDGSYSFSRDETDNRAYYVLAYETEGTETHGVTDRGLVPSA